MFLVTAMTINVVGVLIPEVAKAYGLNLTRAGGLQYATMAGIALAGLFLGNMVDRRGRRTTVVLGLALLLAGALAFNAVKDPSRERLGAAAAHDQLDG